MKSLTQFIQEACKNNDCKIKKILQDIIKNKKDILNDKDRLKEVNDILGESLEDEINENNDYDDPKCKRSINMFKIFLFETYFDLKKENPDKEIKFTKDELIKIIDEFNSLPAVPYKLEYNEYFQKVSDKFANRFNGE